LELLKEQKGQVSAELIIVIAALIAVAIIFVKQLTQTAHTGADKLNSTSKKVFDAIDDIK
jgi:uncharacterized protein (UPF0333 family)